MNCHYLFFLRKSKQNIQESVTYIPRAVRELKEMWKDKVLLFFSDIKMQSIDTASIRENPKGIW